MNGVMVVTIIEEAPQGLIIITRRKGERRYKLSNPRFFRVIGALARAARPPLYYHIHQTLFT